MKKYLLLLVLVIILIINGCSTEKYVCSDGSVAKTQFLCPITSSDISLDTFWDTTPLWNHTTLCDNLRNGRSEIIISFSLNGRMADDTCKVYVDDIESGYPITGMLKSPYHNLGWFEADRNHVVKICCGDVCKKDRLDRTCDDENIKSVSGDNDSLVIVGDELPENLPNGLCEKIPTACACPFPTKYKNDKVAVLCEDCGDETNFLLQKTLEYQTEVYDCLKNYFGYEPNSDAKPIRYRISMMEKDAESETYSSGTAGYCEVSNRGFIGIIKPGNKRVQGVDDLRADVHETAHIFTNSLSDGTIPKWFNEGISIYAESRIQCHTKQMEGFHRVGKDIYTVRYLPLKEGDRSSFNSEAHNVGSLFSSVLENEYNCDINCYFEIVKNLRNTCGINKNCKIDNKKIKESAEKIIEQDLTELFNLLEIN